MQKDARHEAIVRKLLDRQEDDRNAREKRLLGYTQSLENAASPASPARLHKFSATLPCRTSPAARRLLDRLRKQYFGSTVTFPHLANGQQAVMLTAAPGAKPKQIGWVEQCVETDPRRCNVSDQGLTIEADGASMLVLQFRYPATPLKVHTKACVASTTLNFTEIRSALDLRTRNEASPPPLVWVTRPEVDTIDDVGFRDFEAFYVRFKLEVQAAIWSALTALLSNAHDAQWHSGCYYTVVRDYDAAIGRIQQTTIDDRGSAVDIGMNCVYDTPAATDVLFLHLEADILADLADVYFTLLSHRAPGACSLRDEFFTIMREFWANAASLQYHYGSELATVLRISRRAVPAPAQAVLLKQDWITLRQRMFDRFGEGGRDVAQLVGEDTQPPRDTEWPFDAVPPGEINIGLQLLYKDQGHSASIVERRLSDIMLSATRLPTEIQNVVIVAEQLPHPADIGFAWVMKHDRVIAKMLIDESFRDALDSIVGVPTSSDSGGTAIEYHGARDWTIEHVDTFSGTAITRADGVQMDGEWKRGYRYQSSELMRLPSSEAEVNAMRERLYEHLKANILHYQQAIWLHEDPQQRSMRYRKSRRKVPLDWHFEMESAGALTIDELTARLSASQIDGQFATYSTGREAELERLIDASEPLGFYGNCAIYAMRPEFSSEELFSMLHFYKSPYLRYNPDTGEAELQYDEEIAVQSAFEPEVEAWAIPEGFQLVADGSCELVLSGSNQREWDGCAIAALRVDDAQMLLAGRARVLPQAITAVDAELRVAAGAAAGRWDANHRVIDCSEEHPLLRHCARAEFTGFTGKTDLIVGTPAIGTTSLVIVPRKGRWRKSDLFTGAPAVTTDPRALHMIVARGNEVMTPSLVTG